ncbi:hypothetical protein EG68_03119 [Paragonimus skrjabini miyazakii]|uniref:Myosin motor domain-containing protein n=1 Tax=Paragonimus skrjabini miyazakii TaxID=59628 RepID=A0A8S9Z256_9TREM|nr:hypothetical protein EG68_03119 [Paragonimus skrjabini miyazakii]
MKVLTPPDDLLCLHTSEDSVVISSLLQRYELNQIYTWLGNNILISLNPNRDIPELYSETKHDSICRNPNLRCSPHIYALAEQCLRLMRETGSHQSIIISGLSGSGKTETAKHTLKYLVRESARKRHRQTDVLDARFENELEHILLQSNPILEAFGNAQTIRNNNSSRFGKFMTLFYNMEQVIMGATVKVYLLEKPRTLFDDSTICSSFHVFRLFLTSLSKEEAKALGLERLVCDFQKKAERLSSEDQRAWFSVLQSLMSMDYSSTDIEQLRKVLASLLLLNTTRFVPASPLKITATSSKHGSPSGSKENGHFVDNISATAAIHPDDIEQVLFASRLLGLSDGDEPEQFAHQLIIRRIQAGAGSNAFRSRRLTEYAITCNISQAKEQRDCLVKALYNSLFEHLVHTINKRLGSPAGDTRSTELSILDLFGFEQLAQNGFEQYCINYANERLHQNFMRIAVTSIYDDLASEGLASSVKQQSAANILISLQTCDNSSILSAMKTCASLLDEVCLLNRLHDNSTKHTLVSSGCLDQREVDWLRRLQRQRSLSGVVDFSTRKSLMRKPGGDAV